MSLKITPEATAFREWVEDAEEDLYSQLNQVGEDLVSDASIGFVEPLVLTTQWKIYLESVKEHPNWTLALEQWKHDDYKIQFKTIHNKGKSQIKKLLTPGMIDNLDILWKLGNPLLKEKEGGLKLENINTIIKNSGNNHTTKEHCPPIFFVNGNKGKGYTDTGRNFSNSLKRLWSIINE